MSYSKNYLTSERSLEKTRQKNFQNLVYSIDALIYKNAYSRLRGIEYGNNVSNRNAKGFGTSINPYIKKDIKRCYYDQKVSFACSDFEAEILTSKKNCRRRY